MDKGHIARDMVQARLLGLIFANSMKDELALKGGFAMRVLLGSSRYTKDIDLSASDAAPKEIVAKYITKAVNDLKSSGMVKDLILSDPKQTDTVQRWKIGGFVGSHALNLTIEVSRRSRAEMESLTKVSYKTGGGKSGMADITCINLSSMAAAKFDCVKNPIREAPRDIYDLYMMIKSEVRPTLKAIQAYGAETLASMKTMIWDKMEKMDYEVVQQKLLPFLPDDVAKKLTSELWDEMRLVVCDHVVQWIEEAEATDPELDGVPYEQMASDTLQCAQRF